MIAVRKLTLHPTVDYAAEELKKYLRMMMPDAGDIAIRYDDGAGYRLRVLENGSPDDTVDIECDGTNGDITANSPYGVLLAVYEYLRACGCRWLFPGVDGELIPICAPGRVSIHKTAAFRYRGQCNEGAEAQQNMLETIEFSPKIGLNTYMLEFSNPLTYYRTWYDHFGNGYLPKESVSRDTVLQWKRVCETEIQKRGLKFHDMGHGWTAEPFGADSSGGWMAVAGDAPGHIAKYLAEINGKRTYFGRVPLNTNICMSNPEARAIVADAVAEYAAKETNVDHLHIWLADASNNHCECENCRKYTPSDLYIRMLNDIDERLTERGLKTKIVFIVYVDTYWPPVTEKLKHPERFEMLFAPITRDYTVTYDTEADMSAVRPYSRNKNIMPRGEAENMAYYKLWREHFSGDAFCYEYHFCGLHYFDPGYMNIARLVYDDIHGLKKWELKGIIEDQTQRNYFPTGFPMYLYGRALLDDGLSFEDIRDEYFIAAFGEDKDIAVNYLQSISDCFDMHYLGGIFGAGGKKPAEAPELAAGYLKAKEIAESFRPVAEKHMIQNERVRTVSWQLLWYHTEFIPLMADAYRARSLGDRAGAAESYSALTDIMARREAILQRYLDHGHFRKYMNRYFEQD